VKFAPAAVRRLTLIIGVCCLPKSDFACLCAHSLCCVHFGAFDVKTGAVKAPPCQVALRTYKVVLQGDDVYVDLDRNAAGEPA
jgi:hypothetical protein